MKRLSSPLPALVVAALIIFMIADPRTSWEAARSGISLWLGTVVPALLPFFIACDLLLGLGVVTFLGKWLEPIMRPLFRLPGSAGFVVGMGFTSGFPMGAVLTRSLYEQNMLSGEEAERLACFTNNASPLFILGVVGVGLFHSTHIGYLLAAAHYLSNLAVGIISARSHKKSYTPNNRQDFSFEPKRGPLLATAVANGINSVMAVGGFIIMFSVITAALTNLGFINFMARLFQVLGVSYPVGIGLGIGMFEMTLGAKALAYAESDLMERLLAVSVILAWSGFSIQAQVMSMLPPAPARIFYYIKARFLQMGISALLTYIGYRFCLEPLYQSTWISAEEALFYPGPVSFLAGACYGLAWSLLTLAILSFTIWLTARLSFARKF